MLLRRAGLTASAGLSCYILNPAEKYYVAYVINFGAGITLQIGCVTV